MEVQLGAFCTEAVEALVTDKACAVDEAVADALRAYLSGVLEDKPGWKVSPALAEFEAADPELRVELHLDGPQLEGLEVEAARQDITVERLIEQAVIVAYAELDRRRS